MYALNAADYVRQRASTPAIFLGHLPCAEYWGNVHALQYPLLYCPYCRQSFSGNLEPLRHLQSHYPLMIGECIKGVPVQNYPSPYWTVNGFGEFEQIHDIQNPHQRGGYFFSRCRLPLKTLVRVLLHRLSMRAAIRDAPKPPSAYTPNGKLRAKKKFLGRRIRGFKIFKKKEWEKKFDAKDVWRKKK